MNNDMTIQQLASPVVLRIEQGPGAGQAVTLENSGSYVIGRHEDCDIRLPLENKAASRRHASLAVHVGGIIELEDLGSNNGTYKGTERITKDVLGTGDRFSIGENVFVVEKKGQEPQAPRQKPLDLNATVNIHPPLTKPKKKTNWVRVLTLLLLLFFCLGILAVMLGGKDEGGKDKAQTTAVETPPAEQATPSESPEPAEPAEPAQEQAQVLPEAVATGQEPSTPQPSPVEPSPEPLPEPEPQASPEPPASPEPTPVVTLEPSAPAPEPLPEPQAAPEVAQGQEPGAVSPAPADNQQASAQNLYQQGLFFYKAGNLPRAVDSWSKAFAMDPENQTVRKWLLRAEGELDEAIDKHYRQGLLARKYMRYEEARQEFTLVIQWSRDADDERVLDAKKNLGELEEAQ